ncbi:MAG TPA: hypothetical protein VFM18_09835, partial [Methanosarcina sp.]|nr:hypothetical protein [Methanosarcina sp.]
QEVKTREELLEELLLAFLPVSEKLATDPKYLKYFQDCKERSVNRIKELILAGKYTEAHLLVRLHSRLFEERILSPRTSGKTEEIKFNIDQGRLEVISGAAAVVATLTKNASQDVLRTITFHLKEIIDPDELIFF